MILKRIMSALLAAVIAFSCCSAAVFAANDPVAEPIVGDDLDIALLEEKVVVSLLPEEELVQAAPAQISDEIAKELQSVSKPEKGTGIAFTLKDCTFPGFSGKAFFKLLDSLNINTFSGEYRILPDGNAEIVRVDSAQAIVLIPSTICGKKVTSIGDRAFAGGLTSTVRHLLVSYTVSVPSLVFLPATVTSIGDKAFANCTRLTNVIASDYVERIGDMAFAGCVNLRRVLFYSDVRQHLSDASTAMCEIFQKLIEGLLEDGSVIDLLTGKAVAVIETAFEKILFYNERLQEIGKAAFYGCEKLVRFYIPEAVKTIGEYTFYGCRELRKLVIGSAAKLCKWAFANVNIRDLYVGGEISWEDNTFENAVIVKLTYGGCLQEMIDALKEICEEFCAAVLRSPTWKESTPVSSVIDLNVFTDSAAEKANLTFRSLNPDIASVTPDGKTLVINRAGNVELVCNQEEDGTLNDGVKHSITIKTEPVKVHSELNMDITVPYRKAIIVDLSVLRTSDGENLTRYLDVNSNATVEWNVNGTNVKVDWKAEGSVCKIKCFRLKGLGITGTLHVSATVKDADGNIISSATGAIGVDGDSAQATVRLTWWQAALKALTFGWY
ncbi:MAG: leucine-rich repeat domain-containing protein [Clostridia bacterium]|nr:leucine-rich repeat domain-containing protein [Clostridia bacterium]